MTASSTSTSTSRWWRPTVRAYVFAVVMGAAVGLVSVAFLGAVVLLTRLVWDHLVYATDWLAGHGPVVTVVVCSGGGLAVGTINRWVAASPPGPVAHDGPDDLETVLERRSRALRE